MEEHNLQFQKQYGFEDLCNEQGRGYYFDFAIFSDGILSYLIEFDGIQHFSREHQFSQSEDAFDRVDEATQVMWLRSELSKVSYDSEKDKVVIGAPMISVPLYFYQKFGNVALQNAELALHTIQQLEDEEKQRKAEAKAAKSGKRKKNNY